MGKNKEAKKSKFSCFLSLENQSNPLTSAQNSLVCLPMGSQGISGEALCQFPCQRIYVRWTFGPSTYPIISSCFCGAGDLAGWLLHPSFDNVERQLSLLQVGGGEILLSLLQCRRSYRQQRTIWSKYQMHQNQETLNCSKSK